ncbi:PTS sugar transporter subunit IIA [Symbiobacterium thermophilum]|uniref:PTS system enzyme IIABC component n=2 Tax=Symbiobacterium thermophilum TaxID=2734 RepID=Q67SL0_SYMTH|nr:PTS glucose transporter subunit IIA [Symbiobacterium thermophilum]MBY6278288.1 PTS sugar transporter subunit IIABC [Symbiobacterium thermophilum]BAD39333.1 PTS system enzyme IIABC component [Symbiobacterium thermophilum IAM 14863]
MTVVTLLAPITGRTVPLDDVPDPVFAGRMLGDGVAIDPSGDLVVAPAAGEVVALFPTGHALALRMDSGVEILLHLGLDSSRAKGVFRPVVALGDRVETGQPLIYMDLEGLRAQSRSPLSPLVVLSAGAGARADVAVEVLASGPVVAGRDVVCRLLEGRKGDATA